MEQRKTYLVGLLSTLCFMVNTITLPAYGQSKIQRDPEFLLMDGGEDIPITEVNYKFQYDHGLQFTVKLRPKGKTGATIKIKRNNKIALNAEVKGLAYIMNSEKVTGRYNEHHHAFTVEFYFRKPHNQGCGLKSDEGTAPERLVISSDSDVVQWQVFRLGEKCSFKDSAWSTNYKTKFTYREMIEKFVRN